MHINYCLFVETEKALERKINTNRSRLPPMDLCMSASESDTELNRHKVLKEVIICICSLHVYII